jgi:hypothetical protein
LPDNHAQNIALLRAQRRADADLSSAARYFSLRLLKDTLVRRPRSIFRQSIESTLRSIRILIFTV